jgi:hypothetical protein
MMYLLTCLVILSLNFVEIMSECENITMIKYIVNDEEFEDTIITTFADWKSLQVNLQQNTVICNNIFNISIDITL